MWLCVKRRIPKRLYNTRQEAEEQARYRESIEPGLHLYVHECIQDMGFHLARKRTLSKTVYDNPCGCKDKNGLSKKLYETREEAQQMANLRNQDSSFILHVYPCPSGMGWHLTSNTDRW